MVIDSARFGITDTSQAAGVERARQILLGSETDAISISCGFSLLTSAYDFIDAIAGEIKGHFRNDYRCDIGSLSPGGCHIVMRQHAGDAAAFYADVRYSDRGDVFTASRLHFSVELWGNRAVVRAVSVALKDKFGSARLSTVQWWYQGHHGPDYTSITLQSPKPMHDEFYPWLGESVRDFFVRYMESDASVLFLMGPPGTGKTSLLRHFIYEHQLDALVTYDPKIFSNDEMFIAFLSTKEDSVMVIEDQESLVSSRKKGDGNNLMSRFLNVSDGLIQATGRKMIFTTNQDDFSGVDPALIRPGRCFGQITARALTYEEACLATDAAGLPRPARRPEISLTDIFNPPAATVERVSMGFAAG